MQLSIPQATELAVRVLTRCGMSGDGARMVADHLVDAALSGHEFSSLARLPTLAGILRDRPPAGDIRVERETHCSAVIDGGDNIAYVVSVVAIDKAIEICRKSGVPSLPRITPGSAAGLPITWSARPGRATSACT